MGDLFGGMVVMALLVFSIFVALSRWIFRVNDTIKRLDAILEAIKGGK
jgi:hypothetical protein